MTHGLRASQNECGLKLVVTSVENLLNENYYKSTH